MTCRQDVGCGHAPLEAQIIYILLILFTLALIAVTIAFYIKNFKSKLRMRIILHYLSVVLYGLSINLLLI